MNKEKLLIEISREQYIKELSNLSSNKFSKNQTITLFLGILFNFITDKEIFKKNIDIQVFLREVFNKEYKDYLFRSRPYLVSRVLSDVKKEKTYSDLLKLSSEIGEYILKNSGNSINEEKDKKNRKTHIEDNIVGWVNQVNKSSVDTNEK